MSQPSGRHTVVTFLKKLRTDPGLRREADMMGFFLSITLLVALTALGNDLEPHTQSGVLLIVWGSTLGLVIVQWFAEFISITIIGGSDSRYSTSELLAAHVLMAVAIATAATLAVLALGHDYERLGARLIAALAIAVIVGGESRFAGADWRRCTIRALIALSLGTAVAFVKWQISK